ncbi:MAG TPA: lysylphosphatidylglycerol synthase transmembrane domain-containing protein, partial [Methylomirabilota bacterium]|nr:lysylphosphatidylglycerol synthase transmembrane domain-containing protein [Methylomirabilota bacterium]
PLPVLLAVAVSAACLYFLMTPQIVASLARLLADASLMPVVAAFALVALVQWLRAWRFAVMMTGRLTLPAAALTRIAFQLNFWNFLLPLRLGELSDPVLMNRRLGYGLLHAAGVLLIARLFDLATVGAILLGAAAALDLWPGAGRALLALAALALGLAPLGLAVAGLALRPRLARLPRVGDAAARLTAGFEAIGGYAAGLAAVGLSLALWLVFGLAAILVAQAVVATVSPAAAMLGAAAGNIAFALPVNGIAGIGPAQAAWVGATTRAGVPWDDAVVSALTLHAVVLTNALVLGALAAVTNPAPRALQK